MAAPDAVCCLFSTALTVARNMAAPLLFFLLGFLVGRFRLVSYLTFILLLSIILSYLIHTSIVLSFRPGLGVWLLALALAMFPRVLFCFDVHTYVHV